MVMEKKAYTREDIIQTLRELDAESGKPVGKRALTQKGISQYWIRKLITEGLTELKDQLRLKISPQERPLLDDELFEEIDKVVSKFKSIPTWVQLRRETRITAKVFIRRFGKKGIREVFGHYRKWLEKNKPNSKNIKLVDAYLEDQSKIKTNEPQLSRGKASATTMPNGRSSPEDNMEHL